MSSTIGINDRLDYLKMANAMELSNGQQDFNDGITDYLTTGLMNSGVSAFVGIYNTFHAFGQMIGLSDPDGRLDTYQTIDSLFGSDAADFYSRHAAGIDATGLILGSLVPGGAAVRGLRALQVAGKVPGPARAVTGLANPDIVLGSAAVESAKQSVLRAGAQSLRDPGVYRAYATGLKQNVLEAAVFDAAVLATMNQHSTLNPEQLDYLQSFLSAGKEGLPFLFAGAGIGAGIDALRIRGAVKSFVKDEYERTSNLVLPNFGDLTGLTGGSALHQIASAAATHHKLMGNVAEGDWFALRRYEKGKTIIRNLFMDVTKNLNEAGEAGRGYLEKLVLNATEDTLPRIAEELAGATKLRLPKVEEFLENRAFFNRTVAPIEISGQAQAGIAKEASSTIGNILHHLQTLGIKFSDEAQEYFNSPEGIKAIGRKFADMGIEDRTLTSGVAWLNAGGARKNFGIHADNVFAGDPTSFLPRQGVYSLHHGNIDSTYPLVTKALEAFRSIGAQVPIPTKEEFIRRIALHEVSHLKTNQGQFFKDFMKLAQDLKLKETPADTKAVLQNKKTMMGELLSLSMDSRATNFLALFQKEFNNTFAQQMYKLAPELRGKVFMELVTENVDKLSPEARRLLDASGLPQGVVVRKFNDTFMNGAYTTQQVELFAEAGYQLTDKATRQRAYKIAPNLAKEFDSNPALIKSWSPTKSYLNTRTGRSTTGDALGLADMQPRAVEVKTIHRKDGPSTLQAYSAALGKIFKSKYQKLFDQTLTQDKLIKDYLEYDAEWLMWSSVKDLPKLLADKAGNILVDANNLPALENLILKHADKFNEGKVILKRGGAADQAIDLDGAKKFLTDTKQSLWMRLSSTGEINEHFIARMLNVDIDATAGKLVPESWIVEGKRFDRPETVVVEHAPMAIKDINFDVRSQLAIATQRELLDHQAKLAVSEVLGPMYNNLPELPMDLIAQMSPLETRTTLLTNARTIFGSAREIMQYIGKQVADFKAKSTQRVHENFARFNKDFNQQGNAGIRMELAMTENYARQDWYYLVNIPGAKGNTEAVMVRKAELEKLAKDLAKSSDGKFDLLQEISQAGKGEYTVNDTNLAQSIAGLIGKDPSNAGAPAAVQLSQQVGDLWKQHLSSNFERVGKKQKLAGAEGKEFAVNPDLIYPPPKDLTKEKYFGFVVPKTFTAGSDPRKYMVYGRNEQELKAKIAQIQSKYGSQYDIYSNKETKLFREYVKEYTRGEIFDDLYFDSGLKRSGSAAELIPNLDVNVSSTLDRMVSWHINQEHAVLRKAVEIHYGEQIQALRSYDNVLSTFTESRADKRHAEISSIAKDAENLMLDKRSGVGRLEDLWVRVNDYIGEKGSAFLDSTFGAFSRGKADITQASLAKFNADLEAQGFTPPFKNMFEVIAASPDPGVSRTLNNSVRTLNNLAGALMLRLDWAHSFIQLASTPILMMPVLLEAKAALKGSKAGEALENLTTVVNPANGMKEPSISKMAMKAMKNYFTPEGKAFMQQLRENNIVSDYLRQYSEIHDYSQLTGRHTMKAINDKIDSLAEFGGKVSMFTVSEEFTRFIVADSIRQIGELRGLAGNELMAVISGAVDKVHGIYLSNQRPQLFKGALGQAIGLYQTYFFNFVQNATKWVGDANTKEAVTLAVMQSSIFGLQSWPGFSTLNRWIGEANRDNEDIYSITNANDPRSLGAYALFGLGSHAFGFPIDFYTRGDLAVRNATIVANPMNPMEIPAVDLVAKIASNLVGIVSTVANPDPNVPMGEAFLHGLAHNGMNRPLQGFATVLRNRVTSNYGQVYFQNANFVDHDAAQEIDWGRIFARVIGSKPLDESIIMNNYFRQKSYQANVRKELSELGESMQLSFASGQFDREQVGDFAREYERRGGDIQNFNAYFGRQFQQSNDGIMQKFQREMQQDTELRRARDRMLLSQSTKPVWEY